MIIYSGLPRSGTNLLKNLISQNNNIKVSHESALCNMILSTLDSVNMYKNHHYYDDNLQELEILLNDFIKGGIFEIDKSINKTHINHSKLWNQYIPTMISLGYKVIFSVRKITDILYSFEQQTNKYLSSDNEQNLNCNNPFVGMLEKHEHVTFFKSGISFLNDVCINLEKYKKDLLIVKYEDLVNSPNKILNQIYSFIGVEFYSHDLNNIPTYNVNDMHVASRRGISHEVRPQLDVVLKQNKFTKDIEEYFEKKYHSIYKLLGYN